MTKIIAVLLMLGQFEVAVEVSKGYFVATYPDTEIGVTQFLRAIRSALETDPGRFYPCVVYDGSVRDVFDSPLAERIGVSETLKTGLRDPGIANPPWIVRSDRIKTYLASDPTHKLDAKLTEKICLSSLPRNYMQLFPATAGVREFYRRPPPPTDAQITQIGSCEAILAVVVQAGNTRSNYGVALARIRLWASGELQPPGMQHPLYAEAFRATTARLEPVNPGRDQFLKEYQDRCLGLRLD
jgi:hypothetical protein